MLTTVLDPAPAVLDDDKLVADARRGELLAVARSGGDSAEGDHSGSAITTVRAAPVDITSLIDVTDDEEDVGGAGGEDLDAVARGEDDSVGGDLRGHALATASSSTRRDDALAGRLWRRRACLVPEHARARRRQRRRAWHLRSTSGSLRKLEARPHLALVRGSSRSIDPQRRRLSRAPARWAPTMAERASTPREGETLVAPTTTLALDGERDGEVDVYAQLQNR